MPQTMKREDGTFSREDFTFDKDRNVYICPANKILTTTGKLVNDGETLLYRTKVRDCRGCLLKAQCCPKAPARPGGGFPAWNDYLLFSAARLFFIASLKLMTLRAAEFRSVAIGKPFCFSARSLLRALL